MSNLKHFGQKFGAFWSKSENLYFQYFLNSETNSVTKLEYIKQSGINIDVFKLKSKRITRCLNVKGDWNKRKIDEATLTKEQKKILKLI